MKAKLKIIISIIILITFSFCSDKTKTENITTSITLSSSQDQINLGESITFGVIDNNGSSLRSSVVLYVNNVAVTGLTFTPPTEGSYSIYAKYNSINSNVLNIDVTKLPSTSITILLSQNSSSLGQTISFAVNDNYGVDVTSESEFFIDDSKITGNTYTSTQRGTFEVHATYNQLISTKKTFIIQKYTQKVLIEDYTGTWCGYCPRLANAIDLVLAETNNAVPVTIHCTSGSAVDPFDFDDKYILLNAFGVSGYPTAKINRTETWSYPENSSQGVNQVINKLQTEAPLGIGISSTLSGTDLSIDIDVEFGSNQSGLKLVVYLVEDKLIADQSNYLDDLYGGLSNLVNFEHNHVLRHSITDLFGTEISSSVSTAGNLHQQTFNFNTAGSEVSNSANIYIVAFVVNGSTKSVLNVQEAAVNSTVTF